MLHANILEFAHYRYLKLTALLLLICIVAYAWHSPELGPYGGTWLGYTLGTIATLIIIFLMWFGIRKRQYRHGTGTLQKWLSAHIYLGLSLIVIATLHSGFQLGWNVHTLAYLLMMVVIFSGFYGVYAYLRSPRLITENLGDDTLESLLLNIKDYDREAQQLALNLPDDINAAVQRAAKHTLIGGSAMSQLGWRRAACPTDAALKLISDLGKNYIGTEAKANRDLYRVMLRKQSLVRRARRDVAYKASLQIWLYLHVPLSVALVGALIAHIVAVFFYH